MMGAWWELGKIWRTLLAVYRKRLAERKAPGSWDGAGRRGTCRFWRVGAEGGRDAERDRCRAQGGEERRRSRLLRGFVRAGIWG